LVSDLTQAQLDYVPAPDKWSVGEVLDHLILGQRLNLSYVTEVIGLKEAGQRPVLGLGFEDVDVSIKYLPKEILPALEFPLSVMNMFLPDRVRDFMTRYRVVPAQSPGITTPRRGRSADELREDLVLSVVETERILGSYKDLDCHQIIIRHPLLGNNDVPGLLRFVALHEQRHQTQIKEILNSPGFPGST
jgi:DinB family protein